jgi:hypothetical protein
MIDYESYPTTNHIRDKESPSMAVLKHKLWVINGELMKETGRFNDNAKALFTWIR